MLENYTVTITRRAFIRLTGMAGMIPVVGCYPYDEPKFGFNSNPKSAGFSSKFDSAHRGGSFEER